MLMEKRKETYSLADIKAAFNNGLNRTFASTRDAETLGMSNAEVAAVVLGLTKGDFEKSMTSFASSKTWQDVYKPMIDGRTLYVKFTVDAQQQLLLISFKEA